MNAAFCGVHSISIHRTGKSADNSGMAELKARLEMKRSLGQHGFGTLTILTIIGLVSAIFCGAMGMHMISMEHNRVTIELAQEQKQLRDDLEIIFSNSFLCATNVSVAGGHFTFANAIGNGVQLGSFVVESMDVANQVANPDGSFTATFSLNTAYKLDAAIKRRASVRAVFHLSGNQLTDCRLDVDPQEACEMLGATWYSSPPRCGICEKMGGTWNSGQCALGG